MLATHTGLKNSSARRPCALRADPRDRNVGILYKIRYPRFIEQNLKRYKTMGCLFGIPNAFPRCRKARPGGHVWGRVETMNIKMRVSFKARLLAGCALLAMFAWGSNANASVVRIHFSG